MKYDVEYEENRTALQDRKIMHGSYRHVQSDKQ